MRYTHTGGDTAHRTLFAYYPDLEAGIFPSSNNATLSFPPARELDDLIFGDRLEPMEEPDPQAGESAEAAMSPERMEAIAGDWILTIPQWPLELTLEDGTLHAQARGQNRFPLEITSDTTAVYAEASISIVFHFQDASVDSATFSRAGPRYS